MIACTGIVAVGAVYALVVPDVVLLNTGAVPDTFVSWVLAGLGAIMALVLGTAVWGLASLVTQRLSNHKP